MVSGQNDGVIRGGSNRRVQAGHRLLLLQESSNFVVREFPTGVRLDVE